MVYLQVVAEFRFVLVHLRGVVVLALPEHELKKPK